MTDIPYWTNGLSDSEQELFHDLILKFVGRNPREVKRLLNSALMKGAGSVLIRKDGIKFNQGLQLFFVRKILDERYTMASVAGSKLGIAFFVQWSTIVRIGINKEKNFPLIVKVPQDYTKQLTEARQGFREGTLHEVSDQAKCREEIEKPSFAPEDYHKLLQNPSFSDLLHLLADEDIGRLMQIEFPPEERAEEIAAVVGKSKDADIIREAIARKFKKKPDEVTDDDYYKMEELNLSGSVITNLMSLQGLTNLRRLALANTPVSNVGPLVSLTNLRGLYLHDTSVSNVGSLASLTNLQELSLANTPVSDVGSLASLTNLRVLDLSGIPVSSKQVAELQGALPKLKILR